jgi:hypothetical protein
MTGVGPAAGGRTCRNVQQWITTWALAAIVWLWFTTHPYPSPSSSTACLASASRSQQSRGGDSHSSSTSSSTTSCDGPLPGSSAYFFSFANEAYLQALGRITREAQDTGAFKGVYAYTPDDIPPDYYEAHKDTFNVSRGSGYWLWKPYFLSQIFKKIESGDVVMYADAGCEFTGHPQAYIDIAQKYGFLGFKLPLFPKHAVQRWTKGDIFDAVGVDMDTFGMERQHVGGIWLIQKNRRNEAFLAEWLRLAEDHQLISDAPSRTPNHPDFQENRHDQAIYSLLLYKHGLNLVLEDRTFPREISPIIHAARRRD